MTLTIAIHISSRLDKAIDMPFTKSGQVGAIPEIYRDRPVQIFISNQLESIGCDACRHVSFAVRLPGMGRLLSPPGGWTEVEPPHMVITPSECRRNYDGR